MKIRLGFVELALAALIALYAALRMAGARGSADILLYPVFALLVWMIVRWFRVLMRHAIWRLRNRLIVAYLFIALVPILLIALLANLGISIAAGQIAVYLVTAELDSRIEGLAGAVSELLTSNAAADEWQKLAKVLRTRFPKLILYSPHGVYPPDSQLGQPDPGWRDARGLVLRDGLVYGWVNLIHNGTRATAVFPVNGRMLGSLAPGVGETNIFHRGERQGRRLSLLHDEAAGEPEGSANRLPPQAHRFDAVTFGYRVEPIDLWDKPNLAEMKLFVTRTRPSAVQRAIFPPGMEWQSGGSLVLFYFVALQFIVAELIALAIGLSLTRTITGAVHNLYEGTLNVMGGDFSHRIPSRGKDQLHDLSVSFNRMTENLERLVEVEKEKERMHGELQIAQEVQNQLYPKDLPESKTLRITSARKPARMVSGDYYDYTQLPDGSIVFAMGDVAGKGISAALLMASIQSSFRMQLRTFMERAAAAGNGGTVAHLSTAQLASQINQHLHVFTSPEKFATMFLGVYNERSATLTYTNAGHLPPILVRGGQPSRLQVNGVIIGAFSFSRYEEIRMLLEPGDLLVFFTDGISEAENAYGEMYGEDRLVEMVTRNSHLSSEEIIRETTGSVYQWTGSEELQDDMTLLLVRRV